MRSNDVYLFFPLFLPYYQIYLHDNEESLLLNTIYMPKGYSLYREYYHSTYSNIKLLVKFYFKD